jgi:hypothetical protein
MDRVRRLIWMNSTWPATHPFIRVSVVLVNGHVVNRTNTVIMTNEVPMSKWGQGIGTVKKSLRCQVPGGGILIPKANGTFLRKESENPWRHN